MHNHHVMMASAGLILLMTGVAYAEKCTGSWGGVATSTVEFKGGNNVRYCYQTQCWNSEFTGEKTGKLKFRVGDRGAYVEMRAKGSGYSATWRNGSNYSNAEFRCK